MTAIEQSRAKSVKHAYQSTNGPEYEARLRQRGSRTVGISKAELKGWEPRWTR